MSLNGHTALVTGASRGLGRAIARKLAADGAAVCINYVARANEAETLASEIHSAGGRAVAIRADIGDPAQVRTMLERATAELGPISILVNNAGVLYRATLEEFESAGMERMRRTNVDGLIHVTRAVVPGMKERRYGRIVNITSIAGQGTTLPGTSFYAATKGRGFHFDQTIRDGTRFVRYHRQCGRAGICPDRYGPGWPRHQRAIHGRAARQTSGHRARGG